MANYYIAFNSADIVVGVGKTRKEAKGDDKGLRIEHCDEAAYQFYRTYSCLNTNYLAPEWDASLQADKYYLALPHLTVGQLKRFLKNFADDLEVFVWDDDTRTVKACYSLCRNGRTIQLDTELFGRHDLINSLKREEA